MTTSVTTFCLVRELVRRFSSAPREPHPTLSSSQHQESYSDTSVYTVHYSKFYSMKMLAIISGLAVDSLFVNDQYNVYGT